MNNNKVKILFLLFLVVFIVINHFFGYLGHYGWDDMEYARLAKQWADGVFDLSLNHFTYRWTIIGFTGISYKLFGMSDFASALPSMLITTFSLGIIFWITLRMSNWISIIAMTLFVLNQWTIFYSDKIMTDSYVTLGVLGAFATIWHYRFEKLGRYTIPHSIVFAGFLFFAFLSKETVFLIIPVLLFVFISDVWQKRNIKFWIFSVFSGIIILAGYFVLLKIKTGNPWVRFEAISQNSYINPCRYDLLPLSDLFERISYKFWLELIRQIMFTGVIFIIPALASVKFKEWLRIPAQESFFVSIAVLAVLSGNFMTTSFSAYVPMCLDVRHYLFISPLIALAAAPFTFRFFQLRESRFILFITSVILLSVALSYNFSDALYVIVPIFILIALRAFLPVILPLKLRQLLIVLFLITLFIQPVTVMFNNRNIKFRDIGIMIKSHFSQSNEKNIVITDPVLKRISDYYLEFDTVNTQFVSYFDVPNFKFNNNEKIFILINDYTTWMSDMSPQRLPLFLLNYNDAPYRKVDSTSNMRLYEIPKYECLLLMYNNETNFTNNFEDDSLLGWDTNPASLTKEKYFTGLRSNIILGQGYSSTLVEPLASLISDSASLIDVTLSAAVFLTNSADGKMVMSLETSKGKSLQWLGKSLRSEIRNSNEWKIITYKNRIAIPADTLKDVLFKIYFWNDNNKPFYIDDMKVSFRTVNHF